MGRILLDDTVQEVSFVRKLSLAFVAVLVCLGNRVSAQTARAQEAGPAPAAVPPLTTVAQIRALGPDQVAAGRPVELHAILTYYEPDEGQIFIQDATGGIYVVPPANPPDLKPGDAIVVRGTTVPSFSTNVKAAELRLDHPAQFPAPVEVTWHAILDRVNDCRYIAITGVVRSASLQMYTGQNAVSRVRQREGLGQSDASRNIGNPAYLLMDLQMEGGSVRVHIENPKGIDPLKLLDAEVRLEGTAGGLFDGKFQQIGAELWVSGAEHMQVLRAANGNPAALPLTDITRIMSGSYVRDESQRIHVRGSITLYQPGLEMVVETPDRQSVLVNTYEQSPLRIGQVVDVVGFPDPHDFSAVIWQANILATRDTHVIQATPVSWDDAAAGQYPYELISMNGKVAAEVHERHKDTLVIQAGSHVFSADLPRTVWNEDFDQMVLPEYPIGSTVRLTGVCFVHSGGPWNTARWFDLQLRSPQDVSVLVAPPWWTVRRLLYVSAALLGLMITALFWALALQRKVRRQTEQIRLTMESEAARERRIAFLEKERGRVLEAINSMLNLDEVLAMIFELISTQLENRSCWCELATGTVVGQPVVSWSESEVVRRGIYSGAGERLGSLVVSGAQACQEQAGEALEMGASLAALAIDNRRLYETLIHRSQYDQLTNVANRFLLESRLDEALGHAKRSQTHFALVYIDLDQFKMVNDIYGHRVGDAYLQQVAERLSERLRGMDTLARVGGDEFIVLIPVVRNRGEVDEIVERLTRAFDLPFRIDDYNVRGSASIGIALFPEDGASKDELKRVADASMYAHKPHLTV